MPEPLPTPRLCVFDLDGTLVDSLRDVADSLNEGLVQLAQPTRTLDECRYLVGEGVPALCRRALGEANTQLVDRLADLVRSIYRTRVLNHTRPYAGIDTLLASLQRRGIALAVLSNKPHEMTQRVVRAFWPAGVFAAVYGYIEEEYRKPSPVYLLRICAELSVRPEDTWVIGDTPTDVETARAAGATSIGVTWGFRPRADLAAAGANVIVDTPEELASLVAGAA
jgi:phosphoglycolate phosphatase